MQKLVSVLHNVCNHGNDVTVGIQKRPQAEDTSQLPAKRKRDAHEREVSIIPTVCC